MSFLTLFTTPKPFTNPHISTIQRNALRNWSKLPDTKVIVVGDETGLAEAASSLNIEHLPQVERSQWGTPLLSSIFDMARQHSDSPVLAFANADMLFLPDIVQSAKMVAAQVEQYLIVGQRWNLDITESLDFSIGWQERLTARVRSEGELYPPFGSDYFIFPRTAFVAMPDFAIGRSGWDNWMIYHARQQGWKVIDATPSILAIHQNHDYSHLPGGKTHHNLEESQINIQLAGGERNLYTLFEVNRVLDGGKLMSPRITTAGLLRRLELIFFNGSKQGWRWGMVRSLRRLRKRISPG